MIQKLPQLADWCVKTGSHTLIVTCMHFFGMIDASFNTFIRYLLLNRKKLPYWKYCIKTLFQKYFKRNGCVFGTILSQKYTWLIFLLQEDKNYRSNNNGGRILVAGKISSCWASKKVFLVPKRRFVLNCNSFTIFEAYELKVFCSHKYFFNALCTSVTLVLLKQRDHPRVFSVTSLF